ncbi:MAG: Xaa-Pro dipeptidyl-peptidase, partial [Pirellulaceae bacterium]|nr:Xaa-Pro dipeptidyl-peptidase [Pirellulaceae bacterium]
TELKEIQRPVISPSHTKRWVPLGFAVVHSSSPGTGLSQGCPTVGGDNESLAPKAVIDWLCGRANGYTTIDGEERVTAAWCSGKVGMTGTSYNGTLPLAAATTGVAGLEAIIPIAPNTSYYHYYRSNGLVRHPGGYMGEDIDVLYDFIHSGNPDYRQHCDCEVRDKLMLSQHDRVTGDYNDFWASRDYLNDMGPMKAALLMAHGFNDWNVVPEHSVRIYLAAKAKGLPVQFYCHQGGHGGEPPFEMMNRWFTKYLYGIDNGVEKEPKSHIVREGDKRDQPTAYADYPHPDARPITFHLGSGGRKQGALSIRISQTLKHDASQKETSQKDASQKESLIDDASFTGAQLVQLAESEHRLLYVTPELKEPLHISGYPQINVRLASSKPAANLSVWLVSLPWNPDPKAKITDNIVTRGWADPQNHQSLTKSESLVPGRFYDVKFALQPDDQIIPAGKKLGLIIMSSDPEFTLQPPPGTELTIDLGATALELPIVGGQPLFN